MRATRLPSRDAHVDTGINVPRLSSISRCLGPTLSISVAEHHQQMGNALTDSVARVWSRSDTQCNLKVKAPMTASPTAGISRARRLAALASTCVA
jgi:hypothetical protein